MLTERTCSNPPAMQQNPCLTVYRPWSINAHSIDYICHNIPIQQRAWNSSWSSSWDLNYRKWEWGYNLLLIEIRSWKENCWLSVYTVYHPIPKGPRGALPIGGSPRMWIREQGVPLLLEDGPWKMGAQPGCLTLNIYLWSMLKPTNNQTKFSRFIILKPGRFVC